MNIKCSAGVGRTGTLITIDCVLEELQEEKVVDIPGVIIHLRTQRMKLVESLVCALLMMYTHQQCMSLATGPVYVYS